MNRNSVFIFEFVSGGGFNQVDIPSSLFCEGFGMLKSLIEDFKLMDFAITTILDYRIYFLSSYLKADKVHKIDAKDNYLKIFKRYIRECKYIFIIAPESSNILYYLTKVAKSSNKVILSVDLEGIKIGSSKIITYNFFKKNKIDTPKTYVIPLKNNNLDLEFMIKKFNDLNRSIIIKPEDGVGAESIYYFERENQIREFFHAISNNFDYNRPYILQEFIEGKDLSLSLIGFSANSNFPIILTVNAQDVNIRPKSEYFGGYTPVENHKEILNDIARTINQINLTKFNGYFGIDLIRKKDKSLYFLEINPRLTTSYVGLRNVINVNPVELILNSKLNLQESVKLKYLNYSIFSRLELVYSGSKLIREIEESTIPKIVDLISEFITPPISLNKSKHFSCFIATKTKDLESSKNRLKEIKNILEKLEFKVLKSRLVK
ncbi:MAG: ATP-grasp domain-containing protein [Promethearchaeota archaeon]